MEQLTNEAVLEGNEIIANFWCGWKLGELFKYPTHGGQGYVAPDELKFHSSWDWLMPVVEKIEEAADYLWNTFEDCEPLELNFDIWGNKFELTDSETGWIPFPICDDKNKAPIQNAWTLMVSFIGWYNEKTNTISSTPTNKG